MTPREPRAMTDQREIVRLSLQDAYRDLYPKLILYEALVGYRGEHKRRHESKNDQEQARRDFLDSFAYLCDIQKGGSTVTAAALQKLEYSNVLWLSANEGVQHHVLKHADKIREILKDWNTEPEEVLQNQIFQLVIMACEPRIRFYKDKVQRHARNCRMELRKQVYTETGKESKVKLNNAERLY